MDEPNARQPAAVPTRRPASPTASQLQYQNQYLQDSQPSSSNYAVRQPPRPNSPLDFALYQYQADSLYAQDQDMSLQPQDESAEQSGASSSRHPPSRTDPDESSSRGAIGPDDALRTRSSMFGVPNTNSKIQSKSASSPAQASYSSPAGPSNTQPSSTQAGPSYTRPTSSAQVAPSITSPSVTTNRPRTSTRSPFTPPVNSPPRSRPNQVLLINSTSTTALTSLLLNSLRPVIPNALEITGYNAPYPAPTAIDSMTDSLLSSETVLRDLARYSTNNGETVQNFDGLLVASYSKHPLIDALRESYDVPVIGILEASIYTARMLGGRFGIITTGKRTKLQIDDAVAAYGLSHFLIGVESLHVNPLDFLSPTFITSDTSSSSGASKPSSPAATSRSKDDLFRRLVLQSKALVAKGADTVIMGSEFLSSTEAIRAVKDAVRDEDGRRTVNVIDAVEAGVMMLNGLIAMGVPTSKKGLYRSERDTRRARGQNWL